MNDSVVIKGGFKEHRQASNNNDKKSPKKIKRTKREFKFVLLALILVIVIPVATIMRVSDATSYLTPGSIMDFASITYNISDRFGQPIYETQQTESGYQEFINYELFGNLIGHKDRIYNTLLNKNFDLLLPKKINPITGYSEFDVAPRLMKTTLLPEDSQKKIAELFNDRNGCCFAYNYETGEIYTALSFPSFNPNGDNVENLNKCFDGRFIPGSTMKVVTTALAVDQGIKLNKLTFKCNGTYQLPDGSPIPINCHTPHQGEVDFTTAIGDSCNCYFAQLAETLDLDKALDTLSKLGFSVNGKDAKQEVFDNLTKVDSSAKITTTSNFHDIWSFVGQGRTEVNPIDMAQIAAAIVNGGKVAQPYLISSVTIPDKNNETVYSADTEMVELLSSKTANKAAEFWKSGVDEFYYTKNKLSEKIDYAKTGTAQYDGKTDSKLLIGVIESSKTAFYIVIEHNTDDPSHITIANTLADLLPKNS